MRGLRVGIIGLGVGEQHAEAYWKHPMCHLRVLCDLSTDKLAAAARKHPDVRLTSEANEVLTDPDIDLVSIASYDDAHFEQTFRALRSGKHVFVEKPLCRSIKEVRLLKEAVTQDSRLALCSNLVLREAPLYNWLRGAILAGELGRVYAFDGDYLYGRLHKIIDGWRKDVPDYSVIQGGGIHLVDLMLWLTGQVPSKVTAVGNQICSSDSDFRYNDFVSATYTFPSGLIGRITANFGCVHRHQHVIRVFGTRGTFIYDDQGPRFHSSCDPSLTASTLNLSPLPQSKAELIPYFVEGILSGRTMYEEMQHEFDVVSACVAADHALGAACSVEVEYV